MAIAYRGQPRPMPGPDGPTGWEELTDGVLVAAQPHGAPTWFPCNDRMADKATYRVTVRTDPGYRVVSNGSLTAERRVADGSSGSTSSAEPMATYLATLQIGRYVLEPQLGAAAPSALVAPRARMPAARIAFADQPRMIAAFTELFGPYPFDAYTVVVTDDALEIPLESQTLSTFGTQPPQPGLGGAAAHRPRAGPPVVRQHGHRRVAARHLAARRLRLLRRVALVRGGGSHDGAGGGRAAPRAPLRGAPGPRAHRPGAHRTFDDRVYKRGALPCTPCAHRR